MTHMLLRHNDSRVVDPSIVLRDLWFRKVARRGWRPRTANTCLQPVAASNTIDVDQDVIFLDVLKLSKDVDQKQPVFISLSSCRRVYFLARDDTTAAADESQMFLDSIEETAAEGATKKAAVAIFDFTDDLMESGRSVECNALLQRVDCEHSNIDNLLTLLMSTANARDDLEFRASFYDKVRARFELELGHDETSALLDGLR